MKFERTNKSAVGTSLSRVLDDDVLDEQMVAKFGEPVVLGGEEDKGYDGREWAFEDSAGNVFNVYSRYGEFRIGAKSPSTAFAAWLLAELAR